MMRQHTRLIGWTAAVLVMAVFCLLGRWQLQRMEQKQALLDQDVPARAQTLSLGDALAAPPQLRWVEDHGQFLGGTVLLDNQMREGRAGLKVYQPFRSDSGAVVLVDLGWLPMPPDRQLPVIAVRQGEAQLAGLLAPPPAPGLAVGPAMTATAQPGVWLASRMPPAQVAAVLKLEALPYAVLRLDPALPGGYARDLELLPNTMPPSRHLGYAVQWFGLALTVLVVAIVLEWRRQRQPGKPGSTVHGDPAPRDAPPSPRDPAARDAPPSPRDPAARDVPPPARDPSPRHDP